jgi:hypothetical protein
MNGATLSDWLDEISIENIRGDLVTTNEIGNGNWEYFEEDGLFFVRVYGEQGEVLQSLRVGISLSDWGETDA